MNYPELTAEQKRDTYRKYSQGFTATVTNRAATTGTRTVHYREDGLPLCNITFSLTNEEHDADIEWLTDDRERKPCERCVLMLFIRDQEAEWNWFEDDPENPDEWLHLPRKLTGG